MLSNSIVGEYASAVFASICIENNGYVAQSTLEIEYDSEEQRIPPAIRIRAKLELLRLDIQINRILCNNSFIKYVKRLKEIDKGYTYSTYISIFTKQINYSDYNNLKEILNLTKHNTLENCYKKISQKASELNA